MFEILSQESFIGMLPTFTVSQLICPTWYFLQLEKYICDECQLQWPRAFKNENPSVEIFKFVLVILNLGWRR